MPPALDEREFELINIIGKQLGSNQRDLSTHLNLSLGQTNMLIRRLVSKGFIRIQQLNKRKVQYILTPQGFAEKMSKSVKYTLNTINSIAILRNKIKDLLIPLYDKGERVFTIIGKSDLAHLIEVVFADLNIQDVKFEYLEVLPEAEMAGVVLICREGVDVPSGKNNCMHLIQELAKDQN